MNSLLMMAAALLPEDLIIQEINQASTELMANPDDDETKKKLEMFSYLLLTRTITGGSLEKVADLQKEIEEREKLKNLFNPEAN